MRIWRRPVAIATLLLALLIPANAGCDDFLRGAAHVLDGAADVLDDFADDWDRHHDRDRDWDDRIDDILDDIEDWFD